MRSPGHCGPVQVWPIYPFTLTLTIFSSPQAAWTTAKTWEAQVATDGCLWLPFTIGQKMIGCWYKSTSQKSSKINFHCNHFTGCPLNKNNRIPGINLHLVDGNPHPCNHSLFLPSYILATSDGTQNVLGCHKSKYVHPQTVTLLCYTMDIAAALEYRSVQSNTCAGMTSDASSVICKCNSDEKWVQGCPRVI